MNKDEALKMAIEAMETTWAECDYVLLAKVINACKEALEQPAQSITEGRTMSKQIGNSPKPPPPPPPIHICTYSRAMNQEYPRKCIHCGKVEALEQPAQEPVAWMQTFINQKINEQAKIKHAFSEIRIGLNDVPLYTHPHQWQGLTDDEINKLILNGGYLDCVLDYEPKVDKINVLEHELLRIARAIEQALKEKNHG